VIGTGIISFHEWIKGEESGDFHHVKIRAVAKVTCHLCLGKIAIQKSVNTNKPVKSDNLPVKPLWNSYLRLISFSSKRKRLRRKRGWRRRLWRRGFMRGRYIKTRILRMGMIDVTVMNVGTNGREWCPIFGE